MKNEKKNFWSLSGTMLTFFLTLLCPATKRNMLDQRDYLLAPRESESYPTVPWSASQLSRLLRSHRRDKQTDKYCVFLYYMTRKGTLVKFLE